MKTEVSKADIEAVRVSDLFDADWYLKTYPDVKALGMDPAEHFLWLGAKLGRKPSPKFDEIVGIHTNGSGTGADLLLDLVRSAKKEGGRRSSAESSSSGPERQSSTEPGQEMPHAPLKTRIKGLVEAAQVKLQSAFPNQYEVVKAEFDVEFYRHCYADIVRAGVDPVKHYIEHGASEGRNPSPEFYTKYYVDRYPDVAKNGVNPYYHWLTIGRADGRGATPFSAGDPVFDEMCGILGRDPKKVEQDLIARKRDLRERFEKGVLGEMVAKAAKLEPLIAHSWRETLQAKVPPFHSEPAVKQIVAMHRLHEAAEFRRAKAIVVIPHCRLSGSTRIAGHLANALAEIYGANELVVVRTDLDIMQFPEWFPAGCRQVNLAGAGQKLAFPEREKLLVEFLRSLGAGAIFNVNSYLFWRMMARYGKALSSSVALYGYLFCIDRNEYGHWTGYPVKWFYRHFDDYTGMITDSHFLADILRKRYLVPPHQSHKIVTLETPISSVPPLAAAPMQGVKRRPQLFWAGRFDRQKRVDIVYALARRMPDIDFRLWGKPVLDTANHKVDMPGNVTLEGVYADLTELPLEQCDAWLYTAEWDGVPNVLIEIAARGVPLVGSLAGGTGEILIEGLSSPVADIEDISAYESGIRAILENPEKARKQARVLRKQVLERRTTAAYRAAVEALPGRIQSA